MSVQGGWRSNKPRFMQHELNKPLTAASAVQKKRRYQTISVSQTRAKTELSDSIAESAQVTLTTQPIKSQEDQQDLVTTGEQQDDTEVVINVTAADVAAADVTAAQTMPEEKTEDN